MKIQSVLTIVSLFVFSSCAQFSERDPASSATDLLNQKSVLVSFQDKNENSISKAHAIVSGVYEKGLDGHEKWFAIRFKIQSSPNRSDDRSQDFYIQAPNKTQAECIEQQIASGNIQSIVIDPSHNLSGHDFNDKLFFQTTLVSVNGTSFAQENCPHHDFAADSALGKASRSAVLPSQIRY
jgi:hypothetical protein